MNGAASVTIPAIRSIIPFMTLDNDPSILDTEPKTASKIDLKMSKMVLPIVDNDEIESLSPPMNPTKLSTAPTTNV